MPLLSALGLALRRSSTELSTVGVDKTGWRSHDVCRRSSPSPSTRRCGVCSTTVRPPGRLTCPRPGSDLGAVRPSSRGRCRRRAPRALGRPCGKAPQRDRENRRRAYLRSAAARPPGPGGGVPPAPDRRGDRRSAARAPPHRRGCRGNHDPLGIERAARTGGLEPLKPVRIGCARWRARSRRAATSVKPSLQRSRPLARAPAGTRTARLGDRAARRSRSAPPRRSRPRAVRS